MKPTAAIEWQGVSKDFTTGLRGRRLRALDGLSLRVEPGEVVGLLGTNGSGKSTAIKIALGLIAPSAGCCHLFGRPSQESASRRAVGFLPEAPYFYRFLTGRELVAFHGRLCQPRQASLPARVGEVLDWVGLTTAADRRVGTYSKGMLQRLGLAQALVHDPQLVILDEPTSGVDAAGAGQMLGLVLKLKLLGKAILLTSHIAADIQAVCDRVVVLEGGKLIRETRVERPAPAVERQLLVIDALSPAKLVELGHWLRTQGSELLETNTALSLKDRAGKEGCPVNVPLHS